MACKRSSVRSRSAPLQATAAERLTSRTRPAWGGAARKRCCAGIYRRGVFGAREQHLVRSALRRLRRLYGHERAAETTPGRLKAVRRAMIDEGLSRGTINKYINRIVGCFRWGVEEGGVATRAVWMRGASTAT